MSKVLSYGDSCRYISITVWGGVVLVGGVAAEPTEINLTDESDLNELDEEEVEAFEYFVEEFNNLSANSSVDIGAPDNIVVTNVDLKGVDIEDRGPRNDPAEVGETNSITAEISEADYELTVRVFLPGDNDTYVDIKLSDQIEPRGNITKNYILAGNGVDTTDQVLFEDGVTKNTVTSTLSNIDAEPGDRFIYNWRSNGELYFPETTVSTDFGLFPEPKTYELSSAELLEFSNATATREFYYFNEILDVAVLYPEFNSRCNPSEDEQPYFTGEDRKDYKQDVNRETNRFLASSYGSMGALGIDYRHYDRYELDDDMCQSRYERKGTWEDGEPSTEAAWRPRARFTHDAYTAFIEQSASYRDGYEFDGNGYDLDYSEYDTSVIVSPGQPAGDDVIHDLRGTAHYFPPDVKEFEPDDISNTAHSMYLNELVHSPSRSVGTWVHELGHALGYHDLYPTGGEREQHGNVGDFGRMGSGSGIDAPFTSVTHTELHTLFDHIECGEAVTDIETFERAECPWASLDQHEGLDSGGVDIGLESLGARELGDEVQTWSLQQGEDHPVYVLEARGQEEYTLSDITGSTTVQLMDEGVNLYRVDEVDGISRVSLLQNPADQQWWQNESIDSSTLDPITLFRKPTPDTKATFELADTSGSGADYTPTVQISEADTNNTDFVSVTLNETPLEEDVYGHVPDDLEDPGIDLHVYDTEERHTGIDYSTGELKTEIPGVKQENIYPRGLDSWAEVPSGSLAYYEVDTRGLEDVWAYQEEHHNINESELAETEVDLSLTMYGDDATFDEGTGEIGDTHTREITTTVERDGTTSVAGAGYVNVTPETLNAADAGKWVNVTVEVPHNEIDVEDINVSTAKLNEGIQAEDDDQYGFVRNPVEGEVFKAKFPGQEVAKILESGDDVRVTFAAETESGEVVFGEDQIRVIDKGIHSDGSGDCAAPPGASGSFDSVPGLIDCPPGHGGEVPGLHNVHSQTGPLVGITALENVKNSNNQSGSQSTGLTDMIDMGGGHEGVLPGNVWDSDATLGPPNHSTSGSGPQGPNSTSEEEGQGSPSDVPEGEKSSAEREVELDRGPSEAGSGPNNDESAGFGPPNDPP